MPYLAVRDPIGDAKDTFSSWDKCMAKTYCKWPVIVAIVIGSLIVLSTVFCIARCVCCGAELACCCFKCCTCCCPSGSGRDGHKRMKSSEPPPVYPSTYQPPVAPPSIDTRPANQQYRSHAAPAFNRAPERDVPQYATFESPSKAVNEDSLPAMPSWSEAKSSHVEEIVMPEKKGDLELDRLDHNGSVTGSAVTGAAAIGAARPPPARSPTQRSPTDSYGFPKGYQNDSFVNTSTQRGPRNGPGPHRGPLEQRQDGYRGGSPVQSRSPVHGPGAGYSQNQQYGRRSPHSPGYNRQYNQPPPRQNPSPLSPSGYGYNAPDRSGGIVDMPSPEIPRNNAYAPPAPVRSPSPPYPPTGVARTGSPATSYPGQQSYEPAGSGYPGQQTYQAYQPAQEPQFSGVTRKAVDGSWKDV